MQLQKYLQKWLTGKVEHHRSTVWMKEKGEKKQKNKNIWAEVNLGKYIRTNNANKDFNFRKLKHLNIKCE